jgi:membrane associated rhomboid family serine protease
MDTPLFIYGTIALTVVTSIIGFGNRSFFEKNLFSTGAIIKGKEIHRLITSLLLHANWAHLIFNMYSLYSFGTLIEKSFGIRIIAVIYLYSGLGGNLLALVIKRRYVDYTAIGASGAVCGVIFASIFLLPGGSIYIIPIPVPIPAWIYAIFFMAVSLYGMGRGASIIGHEAHLGGALTGIAWSVIYRPSILFESYLLLAGLLAPVLALLAYFIFFKKNPADH